MRSMLYDLLYEVKIKDWIGLAAKEIEKEDWGRTQEEEEDLKAVVPQEHWDRIEALTAKCEDRLDALYFRVLVRTLNLGLQLGAEIEYYANPLCLEREKEDWPYGAPTA